MYVKRKGFLEPDLCHPEFISGSPIALPVVKKLKQVQLDGSKR